MTIGKELLDECQNRAKNMGAKKKVRQILAVWGDHYVRKFLLLKEPLKILIFRGAHNCINKKFKEKNEF